MSDGPEIRGACSLVPGGGGGVRERDGRRERERERELAVFCIPGPKLLQARNLRFSVSPSPTTAGTLDLRSDASALFALLTHA